VQCLDSALLLGRGRHRRADQAKAVTRPLLQILSSRSAHCCNGPAAMGAGIYARQRYPFLHPSFFILPAAFPLPASRIAISCYSQARLYAFGRAHLLFALSLSLSLCSLFLVCCFLLVRFEEGFLRARILKCGGHDFCILLRTYLL
jgi:hypothetical protein